MAISKISIGLYNKVVRSTFKFKDSFENLKVQLEGENSISELRNINNQKNSLSNVVNQSSNILTTLNITEATTSALVTSLKSTSTVIKTLPLPVSTPPGAGIPLGVITTYADSLDTLGDLIKGNEGSVNSLKPIISEISSSLNEIKSDLKELDSIINYKIDEILNQSLREEAIKELKNRNVSPPYKDEDIENILNEDEFQNLKIEKTDELFKDLNYKKIKHEVEEDEEEEFDIERLKPNSSNPIEYKGYILTLENKPDSPYSTPYRRIKGTNVNNSNPQTLYNSEGEYSFSSSVEVLVNEIKYVIDNIPKFRKIQYL